MAFVTPDHKDPKKDIVERFLNLYDTADDLRAVFDSFFTDTSAIRSLIGIDSKSSKEQVAEILVDYLGPNFLSMAVGKNYNTGRHDKKSEDGKYLIRQKIMEQICKIHEEPEIKKQDVLKRLNYTLHSNYTTFADLARDKKILNKKPKLELMNILQFPDVVFESPPKINREEETTTVSKKTPLKPLYDYQTQAVVRITEMLTEASQPKRMLISVPTGAGKTRLTVEAIVDWINNRNRDRVPNSSSQQMQHIIFWFASTNELCSQAASEFINIYTQIGTGGEPFNVTRFYGNNRRNLFQILEEHPGIHIVVTNTEHFQDNLRQERKKARYLVDQYNESAWFKKMREQTAAIIIDEAHEAISDTYKKFLAAMGFDFSGRNAAREYDYNRHGIALIGLTATPYRGSGRLIGDSDEGQRDLDKFAEFDAGKDPSYFARLDSNTKMIHKMFGRVYIPLPERGHRDSLPVPIIEAPTYAYSGEHVKISGLKSFDNFSDVSHAWKISAFGMEQTAYEEAVFYHQFEESGTHNIKLTVTNKSGAQESKIQQIVIYPKKRTNTDLGNLEDNEEFNKILQERKILCKIVYGVIDGPQLDWNESEIRRWRKGGLSDKNEEIIENDTKYNTHICDIVYKSIKKYGRKRVLIFANGVTHAHNLALVLGVKYGLRAKSVDGNTNAGLRRQIIHSFREGGLDVLCNHGVLTSGFDVPEIDTLLICRTVGSNALYTQMIGRGQRGTIAGGTDELWLITAYFKKGKFEDDVRLGWEALADSWENFPPDIKNDLKIQDNIKYTEQDTPVSDSSHAKDPVKTFKCTTCGVMAQNIEEARTLFGFQGDDPVVMRAINEGTFPKNCKMCRDIKSIAKKTHCKFCRQLAENHTYDPTLIMIAQFAYDSLENTTPSKFNDLQKYLFEKFLKKVSGDFFNSRNASVLSAERLNLMTVKGNLDLEFMPIEDAPSLKRLVWRALDSEQSKKKLAEIIKQNKNIEHVSVIAPDKLEHVFKNLRRTSGHVPTSRQFLIGISKEGLSDQFEKAYRSNYNKFLLDRHIHLNDDDDLKDSLYEEYFEKCMREKVQITREQLDKHGQYRISDYEDVFGLFKTFQQITNRVLIQLLREYNTKKNDADAEFVHINRDLVALRKKLEKPLHFDTIRIHSSIGVHRYLIQTKISYLRYVNNYYGDRPGTFLRLVTEFFRLKKILDHTPMYKQFTNLTPATPTAYLGELFGFNYGKFLNSIGETEHDISTEHVKKMKQATLKKILQIREKDGVKQANDIINSAANRYDELSTSIKAWWPDRKELKRTLTSGTSP